MTNAVPLRGAKRSEYGCKTRSLVPSIEGRSADTEGRNLTLEARWRSEKEKRFLLKEPKKKS